MVDDGITTRRHVGIVAGLATLLHLPSLFHPFMDLDEASYAGIACRLLDGGTVYRDGAENKFPAMFFVYKDVFALFGRYNMYAIHVVVTLVAIATALVVGSIAKRYAGEQAGKWASLLYVFASAAYYPKMLAANSEMFAVLPGALAIWCYQRRDRHLGWLVVAGACGALAMLCKQVALASFLAILADRAFTGYRDIPRALRDLALALVGFVAIVALVVWYLRAVGAWDDAVFWTWTYVINYYMPAGSQGGGMLFNLATAFLPFMVVMSPLVYLAVRGRSRAYSVVYWWLVGNVCASWVGGRMYGHYFLLFVPALATLAGLGAPSVTDAIKKRLRILLAVMAGGFFVAACIWEGGTNGFTVSPEPDYREAAAYVAARTTPDEPIFVWGWFPALYHAADRCPSTRFVYTHVHAGAGDTDLGHNVPEAWDMLMADLERAPPKFILDVSPGKYIDYDHPIEKYPRLWAFVSARYEVATTIEGVKIYRRRE